MSLDNYNIKQYFAETIEKIEKLPLSTNRDHHVLNFSLGMKNTISIPIISNPLGEKKICGINEDTINC